MCSHHLLNLLKAYLKKPVQHFHASDQLPLLIEQAVRIRLPVHLGVSPNRQSEVILKDRCWGRLFDGLCDSRLSSRRPSSGRLSITSPGSLKSHAVSSEL